MQFLDRFLAAVVSTPRALKWTRALGMVAATSLVLPTKAQSISGTFQCQSIVINYATGPNNLAVGFTTPSATAGGNPQLPLNVSDGPKTDETCRFENRVLAGGSKTPSEGCSDGGVRLDWFSVQGGLIWSLVR